MSFKPYTEILRRKKLEFVRFLAGSVSRTRPGSGSIILETDPRIRIRIRIKMIRIRNTDKYKYKILALSRKQGISLRVPEAGDDADPL